MKTIKSSILIIIILTLSCAPSKAMLLKKYNHSNEIISDTANISEFLNRKEIKHDSVWVLEKGQMDSILQIVYQFNYNDFTYNKFINKNIIYYRKEFGGYYLDNKKYVIVNMVLPDWVGIINKFTIVYDGGCSVVNLNIDYNNKTIIKIQCNGGA